MNFINRIHDSIEYACAGVAYYFKRSRHRMSSSLTPIEDITQLTPIVCRVLGQNPGPFTLQGTNTYLIGNGKKKILIDTGEPNIVEYITNLKKALNGCEICGIVITHYHEDHVGGIPNVQQLNGKNVPIYKTRRNDGILDQNPHLFQYVDDGHEISVEGATLKFVYTPGHTEDHSAIYLKEENAVFSGDCILGEGTSVFEDLHSYMNSLNILLDMNPARIYPGHGPVIDATKEKILQYISHRMRREEQVVEALKSVGETGASPAGITRIVYPNIPLSVRVGAIGNVRHHLRKLVKDGRAELIGQEVYRFISPSISKV